MTENNGLGPSLLRVQDLETFFTLRKWGFLRVGEVRAVDGVNFDLREGEAVSIVGESGCGKSTLAKTILGLQQPTGGSVHFGDQVLDTSDRRQMDWYRAQVGYIQQDPYGALPPFMTVRRILEEPMIINGVKSSSERWQRMEKALTELKMTPVEEFLHKFPHQLSGGQQQRVVIARAKILDPQLIVSDEPVSMLDPSVRVEILELLRLLQRDYHVAVVYITHDLSTVRYFSERIFVMYGGQLIEKGLVEEILRNAKHPYTMALLEAISDPDPENVNTFKKVPGGEPPSLANPPAGCRFHPRCPYRIDGTCDQKPPPEFTMTEQHRVSCWLYGDAS